MYRFVRCQPHSKCHDLQGWYLVLKPGDLTTFMNLHMGICGFYYSRFKRDPHIQLASLHSPVRLANLWLKGVEKFRAAGITLIVNSSGGIMPLDSAKVLSEIECEKMIWPNFCADEVITISRWPERPHYYLSSNKNRVFVPAKYNTYPAALKAAEGYSKNVKSKGC